MAVCTIRAVVAESIFKPNRSRIIEQRASGGLCVAIGDQESKLLLAKLIFIHRLGFHMTNAEIIKQKYSFLRLKAAFL